MKATRVGSIVIGTLLLLLSTARADGPRNSDGYHGPPVEVSFIKWVTGWPNMAGVVSGDVGAGAFAGEVLDYQPTPATTSIVADYHINVGSPQEFTAHNYVTQDNVAGTAVIRGVVTDGPLKGGRVRGEYQVVSPCGIINAQEGDGGDTCFMGHLIVRSGSEH
jgi:hypothetical protein